LVWQAYDQGRVLDTLVRQKLSDLARGRYRGFRAASGFFVPLKYDLESVAHRHLGKRLDKDTWRLRYAELEGLPLDQWPQGAKDYAIGDAEATLGVYRVQAQEAQTMPEGPWFFVDEVAQVRAAWWLQLVSVWGIKTDSVWLDKLQDSAQAELDCLEEWLTEEGLIIGGVCKTAPIQARIRQVYLELGKEPRLTQPTRDKATGKNKGGGNICCDSDACLESGDPVLEAYIDYKQARKTLRSDIEAYRRGTVWPLHTRFETLAATGRTTSSAQKIKGLDGKETPIGTNIQNIRWNQAEHCSNQDCRSHKIAKHLCQVCGAPAQEVLGIRECFVPRAGMTFGSADYDGLELRTLAQVCLRVVGFSHLAEVLNSGKDPHLALAATIRQVPYEQAVELLAKGDPDIKLARQTAKVANFGFPGGLGADKLVLFARKSYKVRLTVSEAKALKRDWLRTYPEFVEYFKHVDTLKDGQGNFTVEHLFSRRLRAGVFFCVAANSYFQGLGADATKAAGYLILRACYADPSSPLFGCRCVNYIHDEFILEVPDDGPDYTRANAAVTELVRLMQVGAAPFLPDVPATATPQLMCRWSKSAKPVKQDGHLVPWRG
jgi:hypothetical protein